MLRAERTWRGRCLRVTRVTPLTFYPEWMVQVAHQGAGAPQVHGGIGRAFARNYVRRNSLEYSGLRGEGSTPVPLPPPVSHSYCRDNLGEGKLRDISEGYRPHSREF